MQCLRIAYETKQDREQRLARNRQQKELKNEKLERVRRGGAHDDVQLANVYFQLGMDMFAVAPENRIPILKRNIEGMRVDKFSVPSLKWLKENLDATGIADPDNRMVIHFLEPNQRQGDDMRLYSQLSEASGQPRKAVKAVYEALIKQIKHELKHERKIRLPELGRLAIRFRKAKPKRKGRNPFTGKEGWFKAKDASNKIAFRPSKDFKTYVEDKIEVKEIKKKHKKEKKEKKHHKKH